MDIIKWIRKDIYIIILCLIAMLVCITAYMNTAIVLDKCNSQWEEQFNTYCQHYNPEHVIITEEYPVFNISNWVG